MKYLFAGKTRIVARFGLGGSLLDDRYGQTLDVVRNGVTFGIERVVLTCHVEIEVGANRLRCAECLLLNGSSRVVAYGKDYVVASLDEDEMRVPEERRYVLRRTEDDSRLPVGEPVVAGCVVACGADYVARGCVGRAQHSRVSEVESVVVTASECRIRICHVYRNRIYQSLQRSRRFCNLVGSRSIGRNRLLDTAGSECHYGYSCDKSICYYIFHIYKYPLNCQ